MDLQDLYTEAESAHYMGYLVLQTSDDKHHKVIDGQQRITTLSILILAVIKKLNNLIELGIDIESNTKRSELLRNMYIGTLDPVTLVPNNKLKLNRNNDSFYSTYMTPLQKLPVRGIKSSDKLMKQCFEFFYTKLEDEKTGKNLARFVDIIVDKLFFTVIFVGDELNAYKVFETLNARGVQLSSADLLKNYLFSIVDNSSSNAHKNEFEQLENLWSNIIDRLENNKIPDFLRTYWNSQHETVRKNMLFKTIKKEVKTKEAVFKLLRDLNNDVDIYLALKNHNDELWIGKKNISNILHEFQVFNAKQHFSLLLSAYNNLEEKDFIKILKICSVIYFRYNIIAGSNPHTEEAIFNKIALSIHNKTFKKDLKVETFNSIYPSDDAFKTNFAHKEFVNTSRNKKIVKYILIKLENKETGQEFDLFSDVNSVEHILPENPDENWNWEDTEIEKFRYRLGNLCLLKKGINQKLGNATYPEKLPALKASSFKLTKKIAEDYSEWTPDTISERQRELAKKAVNIWRIDF